MNVSLTPRLEAMIREKVESGLYNNGSEVVREALRLMEERDKLERLRAAVAQAKVSVANGEVRPWTPQRLNEIWQQAEQEHQQEEALRAALAVGFAAADRGEVAPNTPELSAEIGREADRILREREEQ